MAISSLSSFAIDEVKLETPEKSLNLNCLSDVYYGRIENNDDVSPILRLFSEKGLQFKSIWVNSVKLSFLYSGNSTFKKTEHDSPSFVQSFHIVEPMVTMRFNENKSEAVFDINLTQNLAGYSNKFTSKILRLYVSHDINEHQKILLGQGSRVPSNYNGSLSTMAQDFVLKSQLGRTMGNVRAVGIRNLGEYKYLDYDIGFYDAARYMQDFGRGTDFNGYVMFKPLANVSETAGNLKIGTSYNIGDYNYSYHQYSFYSSYDYKKFRIQAEYANADGYNGIVNSNSSAEGFYTTVSYDITPKISLVGRYDYFVPNSAARHSDVQEYTAGITYKPLKKMKLMLNYINRNYSDKPDSNMILFATGFII